MSHIKKKKKNESYFKSYLSFLQNTNITIFFFTLDNYFKACEII